MRHEGKEIVIAAGLDPVSPWLVGQEYVDCKILGPAVLVFIDKNTLDHNQIMGEPDAVIWPNGGRDTTIGGIGVRGTTFLNCTFIGVGFTGSDEFVAQMWRNFKRLDVDEWKRKPWWERAFRGR